MNEQIRDRLPGAGPARTAYLRNRIDRTFAPIEHQLDEVELSLSQSAPEGHHCVELTARLFDGDAFTIEAQRQSLGDALDDAFESARQYLIALDCADVSDPADQLHPTWQSPAARGRRPNPRIGSFPVAWRPR